MYSVSRLKYRFFIIISIILNLSLDESLAMIAESSSRARIEEKANLWANSHSGSSFVDIDKAASYRDALINRKPRYLWLRLTRGRCCSAFYLTSERMRALCGDARAGVVASYEARYTVLSLSLSVSFFRGSAPYWEKMVHCVLKERRTLIRADLRAIIMRELNRSCFL